MNTLDSNSNDLRTGAFVAIGGALVVLAAVLRFTYAEFGTFTDGDQAIIATGAVSLDRGVTSRLYNYPEQLGYYEVARVLNRVLCGGRAERMGDVMTGISAAAGVLLSLLALLGFPAELSRRARVFMALFVVLSPVLWRLTQYGNTATPSATLVFLAFVVVSRWPGILGTLVGSMVFAGAMLVRSDAILVAPALAFYAWMRGGAWWKAVVVAVAGVGVAMAVSRFATASLELKPLSDTVLSVMFNTSQRGFWITYLFWGIGPTIWLFAAAGWPALGRLPVLWKTTFLWAAAPFAFYAAWATTPRYTMLLVVPVAMCAALGAESVVLALRRRHVLVRVAGFVAMALIATQHMVLCQTSAVPGTRPGERPDWFKPLTYQAGDGPHFYGALLMQRWSPVPRQHYPRAAAGKDLAALAASSADRDERWVVVVDYWDDVHTNAFYLIADARHPYALKATTVTFGKLTLDFVLRGAVDGATASNPASAGLIERLRSAARIFRETPNGGVQIIPKLQSLLGGSGNESVVRGESGELVEFVRPSSSRAGG